MYEAKVILDSVCEGQRLTTMQLTHPRIVHSEFLTHAMFARNASSSRAIPFKKAVQAVLDDPFMPDYWGINKSGMVAAEELQGYKRQVAIEEWLKARNKCVKIASDMAATICPRCYGEGKHIDKEGHTTNAACLYCDGTGEGLNVHKQIVNRLIEPWSWITVCVTGDAGAWSNYFSLRCHPDAQPDIQKQAYMAQKEYFESTPQVLEPGQWHTPYIKPDEFEEIGVWLAKTTSSGVEYYTDHAVDNLLNFKLQIEEAVVKISTGRCARTSYLTQEGTRNFSEDIKLHDRLCFHKPLHASPLEHVCQAMGDDQRYAKYKGWKSYRHFLPNEYVTEFQPNYKG